MKLRESPREDERLHALRERAVNESIPLVDRIRAELDRMQLMDEYLDAYRNRLGVADEQHR